MINILNNSIPVVKAVPEVKTEGKVSWCIVSIYALKQYTHETLPLVFGQNIVVLIVAVISDNFSTHAGKCI